MSLSIEDILSSHVTLRIGAAVVLLVLFVFFRPAPAPVNAKKREYGQFTRQQVAQHCRKDDVWIILKQGGVSKVYDVTSYVDEHPGGDAILTEAGGDSTDAFFGPQHPPRVHDMIEEFCIGTVQDLSLIHI